MEYFRFLRDYITKKEHGLQIDQKSTDIFKFYIEQRLECTICHHVNYKVIAADDLDLNVPDQAEIDFQQIFQFYNQSILINDYQCTSCNKRTQVIQNNKFHTFPTVLVCCIKRFKYESLMDWCPTKSNISIVNVNQKLDLNNVRAKGIQPHERQMKQAAEEPKKEEKLI